MNVGVIGTGAIGLPIAERILNNGFNLCFYARNKETIDYFQKKSGTFKSIMELGSDCEVVLLILNTYEQCFECLKELLKTMKSGTVIVNSTISPQETRVLYKICLDSQVDFIAAPVTGGVAGAKKGELTIITAGHKEVVEKNRNVLSAFGSNIVYMGEDVGTAAVMKLLVQMLVGINTAAASEALTLGVKCGLPAELIYNTICSSAGVSKIFQNRANTIIDRNFSKRGTIDILTKDLKYCAALANDTACPLPMVQTCCNIFQAGQNTLENTSEDFSAIVKVYEEWANIVVKK